MSWEIGCSRNRFFILRDKSKVFRVRTHYDLKGYYYTVLEAQSVAKLENWSWSPDFQNVSGLFLTNWEEQILFR